MPGAEIPVWIGGIQKWVTGLTKRTTCEDVVRVLLQSEGRPQVELDTECAHYVLIERWRKVERPLDSKTRVLKVWKAWAEEQPNVKLTLRRSATTTTIGSAMTPTTTTMPSTVTAREMKTLRNGSGSRSSYHVHGPRSRSRHSNSKILSHIHTVHPRKLLQQHPHYKQCSEMDERVTGTMERLMKVIIAQGQTIQAQLQRLQDKDNQIDVFEQRMHVMRVEEMGANYLLDSYLGGQVTSTRLPNNNNNNNNNNKNNNNDGGDDDDDDDDVNPDHHQHVRSRQHRRQHRMQQVGDSPSAIVEPAVIMDELAADNADADDDGDCRVSSEAEDCEETEQQKVREVRRCARHYERLLLLSDRLEREENLVTWLASQIDHLEGQGRLSVSGSGDDGQVETEAAKEVQLLRERVGCLEAQNVANDAEMDENESIIVQLSRSIADKQCYVAHLERDLSAVESDACRMKRSERNTTVVTSSSALDIRTTVSTLNDDEDKGGCCLKVASGVSTPQSVKDADRHSSNDTDSNSDTGLSSLHSSCDEGGPATYVLDTLV